MQQGMDAVAHPLPGRAPRAVHTPCRVEVCRQVCCSIATPQQVAVLRLDPALYTLYRPTAVTTYNNWHLNSKAFAIHLHYPIHWGDRDGQDAEFRTQRNQQGHAAAA